MGNFGIQEILIVLVVIVLLFGSSRLPRIARGTGKHLRKTKDSVGTFKEEFERDRSRRAHQGDHGRRGEGQDSEGREDRLISR